MNSGRGKLFFFLNEYFQDEFTEHTTYIYVKSEKLYIEVLDFSYIGNPGNPRWFVNGQTI